MRSPSARLRRLLRWKLRKEFHRKERSPALRCSAPCRSASRGSPKPETDKSTGALCPELIASQDSTRRTTLTTIKKKKKKKKGKVGALGQRAVTSLATLNVRTLGTRWEPRLHELVASCIKKKILLLAVQEHRLHAPDGLAGPVFDLPLGSGWHFRYTACTAMGQGGVGILLSPRAEKALDWVKSISDRILSAQLSSQEGNSRLKTHILCVYSPTSALSSSEASSKHYDTLSSTVGEVPLGQMLIVLGDMNATLQSGSGVLFTPPQKENANTPLLSDLIDEHDLLAINTRFRKKTHHLITFHGTRGRCVCLDYVLCRSKWRSCFTDAFSFRAPIESDHKVLVASFKWRFASHHVKPAVRHDVSTLRTDPQIFDSFQNSVLESLGRDEPTVSSFSSAVSDASAKHLPLRCRSKTFVARNDPDIIAARQRLSDARNGEDRRRARVSLSELYDSKTLNFLLQCGQEVTDASLNHKHRAAYQAIKRMTGHGVHRPFATIPADSAEERLETIKNGLTKLFSVQTNSCEDEDEVAPVGFIVDASLKISDEPFTINELTAAANSLKNDKAADMCGVTAEVLKLPRLAHALLSIISPLFAGEAVPDLMLNSVMVLLFKKGDPTNLGNYRGITIINLILKLYMRMVLNRMADALDPALRGAQNGFRRGRSTVQHILSLRRIIEETQLSSTASLYIVFVDFTKAFDTIKWSALWAILRAYRVPEKLIAAIRSVYVSSKAQARTADGLSGAFEFFAGVKQGCCLSPFLFIIVIDFIMRRATDTLDHLGLVARPRNGSRQPAQYVTDTGFADDIAVISTSLGNLQTLVDRMVCEAGRVGLMVNVTKTVLMALGHLPADASPSVEIYGKSIEHVADFRFLGSWIKSSEKDFNVRRALAWKASMAMLRIWKSESIPNWAKRSLFRSTVEPVLLYGAEAWTMTAALRKKLDGTYTRLLRHCLRVTYLDRWTNAKLYGDLHPISEVLDTRRLAFVGHCARTDQPVAKVLFYKAPGTRRRGGQKATFVDALETTTGLTRDELVGLLGSAKIAKDPVKKREWAQLVSNSRPAQRPLK